MIKAFSLFVVVILAIGCNSPAGNSNAQKIHNHDTAGITTIPSDSLPVFTAAMLDSKKDLVCGMPVTAGIADTAHYKGKAYGFCDKECKDAFVKEPEQYLSAK